MKSGISLQPPDSPTHRRFTQRSTMRIFKENIDKKIIKIKKYSKWLILLQLPLVYSSLYKYCNFDYNALLIKRRYAAYY